jgi:glycosyltransferase involved in cell wall biosynthesis
MTDTTVVIKTIGRKTLKAAISSAKREGFKTIVISDGVNTIAQGANKYIKLGKQWGYYGGMAANVGAAIAETEFITFLDDDDQFMPGAGDIIRRKLKEKPEVDVWSGGVRFCQQSRDLAMNSTLGVVPGNVAMPTYRTMIFSKIPFTDSIPADQAHLTDFHHINACAMAGLKLDWFGGPIYMIRPEADGRNGGGKL